MTQKDIERSIIKTYRKTIWRPFVRALKEYQLIRPGDHVAVCVSGGKDSFLLAKCMQEILRHGEFQFGLQFLVMDPGYHPDNRRLIEENAALMGIPVQIFDSDIFEVVTDARRFALLSLCPDAPGLAVCQGQGTGLQQNRSGPPF